MMWKRLLVFVIIIFLLGLLSIYYPKLTGEAINEYEKEKAVVVRVIDGDTIEAEINDSIQKIRLLGINTPERGKPYYNEAKDFLKQIENKSVFVLRDFEDEDKYNRKLRYVFYEDRLLNIEILQEGLATSFMIEGLKYETKFENAERFARANEIRSWKKSDDVCSNCIELVELNPVEEFFILKNKCAFDCDLGNWTAKDNANHFFKLEDLHSGEQKTYNSKGKVWNNDGDRFFMGDGGGGLVLVWEY